jgi:hypothetical protein
MKQDVHSTFTNETGRLLMQIKQKSTEEFEKYIKVMKNVVDESNSCSNSVQSSLDAVGKNFKKISE